MAVKITRAKKEEWKGFSPEEVKEVAKKVKGKSDFDRSNIVFEAKQRKLRERAKKLSPTAKKKK